MNRAFPLLLAAAAIGIPATLSAQAVVQSLAPGDADLLAVQMRALAANPRDLNALAAAGELSIKLGDLSGAAALFARADKIDSRNGRVKAGMGSILVRSERPGEALRFFNQAEAAGWSATRFAADRGLAYDLIGEQRRAQADYRVALAGGADDETVRRYALSLGIAGRQADALAQLDPLVRKQDRAAWRARAFVLAMGGDRAGAEKIATTMMPSGVAQGLGLFFQRLPTLASADRAFAVHFGEIAATPERIADARLTPTLAALPPEPVAMTAPVQVAALAAPTTTPRRQQGSARPGRQPLATAPVTVAAATPAPGFATQAASPASAMRETDVRVAATTAPVVATPRDRPALTIVTPGRPTVTPPAPAQVAAVTQLIQAAPAQTAPIQPAPVQTAPVQTAPVQTAPVQTAAATQRADSVLARIVASLSIPASELDIAEPVPAATAPVRPAVPATVADAPRSTAGRRVVAEAAAKEARDTAVRRTVAARLTGDAEADDAKPLTRAQQRAAARRGTTPPVEVAEADAKPLTRAEKRAAARKAAAEKTAEVADADLTPAQRRAAARKAAADRKAGVAEDAAPLTPAEKRAAARKALADKKAAAEKKDLADKAAAEKKAARSNPSRIWVQVAGGANAGDLTKAWSGVRAKSPALAGRAGYATPLRATNRVLTGPFKTDAEARAFVNQLAKQGVSAFPFTSDSGQPVTKLGGK